MYVELLGLPASGKSTLKKYCMQHFKAKNVIAASSVQLDAIDKARSGYMWRHPVARIMTRYLELEDSNPELIPTLKKIATSQPTHRAMLLAEYVRQTIHKSNTKKFDVVLSEEGSVHRSIHLINRSGGDKFELLDQVCRSMPPIDALIYLKTDPITSLTRAHKRLCERSGQSAESELVKKRIFRAHGSLEDLKHRKMLNERAVVNLRERGCIILEISGDDSEEETYKRAKIFLDSLVDNKIHMAKTKGRSDGF